MLQVGHPCGLCNRLDVITTGYVLARMQGEDDIEVHWPLNEQHMPVTFQDLFTSLPSGRVLEREIDAQVSASYYAAQAALPADYRDSEFYRDMLGRLLDRAVPEVQDEVSAFVGTYFHRGDNAAPNIGVHIRRSEAPLPLCPYAQPLRYY